MRNRVDIAIIGSGITGLSTAYSLVNKGCRDIMLLEKGSLASGASTRNGGGIRAQFSTEQNILLAMWSIKRFRELGTELNVNFWFRQGGYLFVAETDDELSLLKRTVAFHRRFNLGTKMMDCSDVQAVIPQMVCKSVIGGAFRKGDGVLFPFPLLFGYAEHLKRAGVNIETRCEVSEIRRSLTGYELTTSRGTVFAEHLLNAAGGWSSDVAKLMGTHIPTNPVRHQIMVSEPLAPFLDPMVVTLRDGFYMSQGPRGELVGGIAEAGQHKNDPRKSGSDFCRQISSRIVSLFPRLGNARMMRQWAGYYDMSPDANPILDEIPGFDKAYLACGFSGHGFMISPAVGEFMASLILGERLPFPREPSVAARWSNRTRTDFQGLKRETSGTRQW